MIVTIRPLKVEDAYTSVKWRNDPEVFKYTGNIYNHEITIESELEWIKRVISNANDYRCAILVDNIYVGNIYITDIHNGIGNYHIFIGEKDYWGKGVAKMASVQIIEYGFNVLGLNQIKLKVRPANKSALYLYTSLGFKKMKENDMIEMSITKIVSGPQKTLCE